MKEESKANAIIQMNTNVLHEVIMASTLIQFRVEESLKKEATEVYEKIGVDLSSALRTFLKRSIKAGGYPFDMSKDMNRLLSDMDILLAMTSAEAKANGVADMTLEEINEEIRKSREGNK